MATTGCVATELALQGIVPLIVSPNPKDKLQLVRVPFGPMLNKMYQPCKPGQCFKSTKIYNQFQLKKQVEFNEAWSSNLWFANVLIFRRPEKKRLPVAVPTVEGRSPLGEIRRILNGLKRIGVDFYGSGGNPGNSGTKPPDARSQKTMRVDVSGGAFFETAQTIRNKHNTTAAALTLRMLSFLLFIVPPPRS